MQHRRLLALLAAVTGVATLGGCAGHQPAIAPAASPPTAVAIGSTAAERVVSYPEGRWQLHGDGTARSPYFWVWIPTGTTPPDPPPPSLPR